MAFKLLDMAEKRWRRINAPELAQRVANGDRFQDGILVSEDRKSVA
jgi:hypothetical protein